MRRSIRTWAYALVSASLWTVVATAGWSQRLTWLGTLGGGSSVASAVSADGSVVVGYARNASGYSRACRWTVTQSGIQIEDLNQTYASLLRDGSALWKATAISPDGRYIVGQGYNRARGRQEAFLLDTVPEPVSVVVLGAGLAGLLKLRRRRA